MNPDHQRHKEALNTWATVDSIYTYCILGLTNWRRGLWKVEVCIRETAVSTLNILASKSEKDPLPFDVTGTKSEGWIDWVLL